MTRSSIRTTGLNSRVVTGDECFVGVCEVCGEQRVVAHFNSGSASDLEQKCAGDAFEQAGLRLRRQRNAVTHQKEIGLGALRQLATIVAHQRLFAATAMGGLHRERVVQEIVRLDDRVDRARMIAQHIDERDRDALARHPFGHFVERLDDDDERGFGCGFDVVRELSDAARQQHPDVRFIELAGGVSRLPNPSQQLTIVKRHIQGEMIVRTGEAGARADRNRNGWRLYVRSVS